MESVASPTSNEAQVTSRLPDSVERKTGLLPSRDLTIDKHRSDNEAAALSKPPLLKHVSSPAYSSPLRHHHRNPSAPHKVKESLDARSQYVTSQDDGVAEHRINQYTIKQEIGRGSFGAVHLALDQFDKEYAVKEFSKARLRKRAQSHILRQPLAQRRRGALQGFNSPLHRMGNDSKDNEQHSHGAIDLIKEELAIMKKLNHPNLVSLIEVLDDPSEDSLYMVMEMCKKGVVMKVDLEHQADPYPDDLCRYWFRDLVLGIEYLHAQGVVHRDIKPDNCLITSDDVLKVVDFGVSEMFEKDSPMKTAKSAGSPAFLPPELCVAKHGDISGKAADIWSMGVTLYCLKFGKIPFERDQIMELYDSIQTDDPDFSREKDQDFQDLMRRLLEKDPTKRITMRELREHSWVTQGGSDPLLTEEENTAHPVEPPTEAEMNAAITGNMRGLMTVVKAVNKFKAFAEDKRPPKMSSILGDESEAHFTHPPGSMAGHQPHPHLENRSHSLDTYDRHPAEGALVVEGIHRDLGPKYEATPVGTQLQPDSSITLSKTIDGPPPFKTMKSTDSGEMLARLANSSDEAVDQLRPLPPFRSHARTVDEIGRRGHAHDPLEDHLYLYVGPSTFAGTSATKDRNNSFVPDEDDMLIVSESPGAADLDIYETAYRDEIERILAQAKQEEREPQVYLTRRVDEKLLAISGLAGKWMAVGEEAKDKFKDHAQFSARKAKVADVSRALREAAKEEYEKRRQERKALIEAAKTAKTEKAKALTQPADAEAVDSPTAVSLLTPGEESCTVDDSSSAQKSAWKGKAVDRGRQARSSLMGVLDLVKTKSRPEKR